MQEEMNVRRIAELAKLSFTDEEAASLQAEMNSIIAFARQLDDLALESVPMTQHIVPMVNVLRADETGHCLSVDRILRAAPAREDAHISVPRTVEGNA